MSLKNSERDTLTSRRFPGGSIEFVSARSPRNLRRRTARILAADETDVFEETNEGPAVDLGIARTITYGSKRRIILGSSPGFNETSVILKSYAESDQRRLEVPCPECGSFHKLAWTDIRFDWDGVFDPDSAAWRCPSCQSRVEEHLIKTAIRNNQTRWNITRPEVKGHAGFEISSLYSDMEKVRWPELGRQWAKVHDDPPALKVFLATALGEGWDTPSMVDRMALRARGEPFSLRRLPPQVLTITAAADVQDDRVEITFCGWSRTECFVLAHVVVDGHYTDKQTWKDVMWWFTQKFPHALGGALRPDAVSIDEGDGQHTAQVRAVVKHMRQHVRRHAYNTKGVGGARDRWARSGHKKNKDVVWLVAVDEIKDEIFHRLRNGCKGIHFSEDLPASFYDGLASEHLVTHRKAGQLVQRFERISERIRNEPLDCLTYNYGLHELFRNAPESWYQAREAHLRSQPVITATDELPDQEDDDGDGIGNALFEPGPPLTPKPSPPASPVSPLFDVGLSDADDPDKAWAPQPQQGNPGVAPGYGRAPKNAAAAWPFSHVPEPGANALGRPLGSWMSKGNGR